MVIVIAIVLLVVGWVLVWSSPFFSAVLIVWPGLGFGGVSAEFGLFVDSYGMLFIGAVFMISGSTFVFSSWYMSEEKHISRFNFLLVLFVACIVVLIISPNLVTLLVGWDGLGVTSFLLVVYYQNSNASSAGLLTFLTNRIGDVLVLVSIGMVFQEGSWLVYESSWVSSGLLSPGVLVLAIITNSAQLPFSCWLPAAIAAPTPVSALVHSSTLVTAGVYVLFRMSWAYEEGLYLLKVMSLLTLVLAGWLACVEVDVNKIVALSTLSQLSVMMFSMSIGINIVAYFHIVSHAFFNALLFLCVGAAIHGSIGWQDLGKSGSNWSFFPVSMSCLVVGLIALCGLPFLSGFYSNDLLVSLSLISNESLFFYILGCFGVGLSGVYSLRLLFYVLYGLNGVRVCGSCEPLNVKLSVSSLLVSSVVMGWVLVNLIEATSQVVSTSPADALGVLAVVYSPASALYLGWNLNDCGQLVVSDSRFLASMAHIRYLSGPVVVNTSIKLGDVAAVVLECGWLEVVGAQGCGSFFEYILIKLERIRQNSFLEATIVAVVVTLFLYVVLFASL